MESNIIPNDPEELSRKVIELQKEVDRLNAQLKEKRFGLTWIDVPEAFEKESENSIPVLEEVPDLAIHNKDGKPTHILIEGDNYHALTCLNYTHRGKIDVIYIDPPYNTGNDGFTYKDRRVLDKYPDGEILKSNHPLRHSLWLSFMSKRLFMSRELLSDTGIIFISIDDNEQANLKLLCDGIFGQDNFIANIIWKSKSGGANDSRYIAVDHEYVLCYGKKISTLSQFMDNKAEVTTAYNLKDENGEYALDRLDKQSIRYSDSLNYEIIGPDGKSYFPQHKDPNNPNATWRWSKETVRERYNELVFNNGNIYTKNYKKEANIARSLLMDERFGRTRTGKTELASIIPGGVFSSPKPTKLIIHLLNIVNRPDAIILDYFAGSGTTLNATILLNAEDGGSRQCILCQSNESEICKNITYERNKRIIRGFFDKSSKRAGLGNSLKYYRTTFVGKNQPKAATDDDKLTLAKKAGCLLSLAENTLYETETTDFYQMFTDEQERWTCIYYQEDYSHFEEFRKKVIELEGKEKSVYVFCWTDGAEFATEFEFVKEVTVKSIPQPILDIYKSLNA